MYVLDSTPYYLSAWKTGWNREEVRSTEEAFPEFAVEIHPALIPAKTSASWVLRRGLDYGARVCLPGGVGSNSLADD